MKAPWLGAVLGCALVWASPAAADVRLTIANGHVSISATNATTRQILQEWARVGQARVVNIDRLVGPPVTIEISDRPEAEALEILLRSVGGYILAPRQTDAPDVSRFDRILILPVSSVPGPVGVRPAGAAAPRPTFPQPQLLPPPRRLDGEDDTEQEPAEAPDGPPVLRQPPDVFPQPRRFGVQQQDAQPESMPSAPQPAPSSTVTAPPGVAVPGMVIPAPDSRPGSTQR